MKSRRAKREEAAIRQTKHDQRSPEEQYAKLDRHLGKGAGATKERRKLLLQHGWSQQLIDLEFPAIQK